MSLLNVKLFIYFRGLSAVFQRHAVQTLAVFSLPQETQQIPTEEVQLEVHLSNSQKVKVNVLTSDQTEDVLEVKALWSGMVLCYAVLVLVQEF